MDQGEIVKSYRFCSDPEMTDEEMDAVLASFETRKFEVTGDIEPGLLILGTESRGGLEDVGIRTGGGKDDFKKFDLAAATERFMMKQVELENSVMTIYNDPDFYRSIQNMPAHIWSVFRDFEGAKERAMEYWKAKISKTKMMSMDQYSTLVSSYAGSVGKIREYERTLVKRYGPAAVRATSMFDNKMKEMCEDSMINYLGDGVALCPDRIDSGEETRLDNHILDLMNTLNDYRRVVYINDVHFGIIMKSEMKKRYDIAADMVMVAPSMFDW